MEEQGFLTKQEAQSVDRVRLFELFASPLGQEMKQASALFREFPFSILVPAQNYFPEAPPDVTILLQGVIDCFFEADEGITLVDFKTDYVTSETILQRAAEYRTQLETYALALAEVTGKRAVRKVLYFLQPGQTVEVLEKSSRTKWKKSIALSV